MYLIIALSHQIYCLTLQDPKLTLENDISKKSLRLDMTIQNISE